MCYVERSVYSKAVHTIVPRNCCWFQEARRSNLRTSVSSECDSAWRCKSCVSWGLNKTYNIKRYGLQLQRLHEGNTASHACPDNVAFYRTYETKRIKKQIWIIDSLQPEEPALHEETYRRSKVAQCSWDKRLCVYQTAGYQCNHHLLATQAR